MVLRPRESRLMPPFHERPWDTHSRAFHMRHCTKWALPLGADVRPRAIQQRVRTSKSRWRCLEDIDPGSGVFQEPLAHEIQVDFPGNLGLEIPRRVHFRPDAPVLESTMSVAPGEAPHSVEVDCNYVPNLAGKALPAIANHARWMAISASPALLVRPRAKQRPRSGATWPVSLRR